MSTDAPPAATPLMKFVLVMHAQTPHQPELLASIRQFAAPRILASTKAYNFWDKWRMNDVADLHFVRAEVTFEIAEQVRNLIGPWMDGGEDNPWVIYLPHWNGRRATVHIQHFLQFVGVQPPTIKFVRSITKAKPDERYILQFNNDGQAPTIVPPPVLPDDCYELTPAFYAWRLNANMDRASPIHSGEETAYWSHAEGDWPVEEGAE